MTHVLGPSTARIFVKCMTRGRAHLHKNIFQMYDRRAMLYARLPRGRRDPEQPLPLPPAVVSWRSEGSLVTVVSRYARAEVVADITGR